MRHTVYAGSYAANGAQANYGANDGERPVTEDDPVHPYDQYSRHKVMNEWQALDYIEKHGMRITGMRTGHDKTRGSVHHVRCITEPALGRAVTLPSRDIMQCMLHVDDMAEVFARLLMADAPAHRVYNSGGTTVSLGELAEVVRSHLPDARIGFEQETGARERNPTYLPDNSRLTAEFGFRFRPFSEQVLQVINDTRRGAGLSLVGDGG